MLSKMDIHCICTHTHPHPPHSHIPLTPHTHKNKTKPHTKNCTHAFKHKNSLLAPTHIHTLPTPTSHPHHTHALTHADLAPWQVAGTVTCTSSVSPRQPSSKKNACCMHNKTQHNDMLTTNYSADRLTRNCWYCDRAFELSVFRVIRNRIP
jgi:hypothetical protein